MTDMVKSTEYVEFDCDARKFSGVLKVEGFATFELAEAVASVLHGLFQESMRASEAYTQAQTRKKNTVRLVPNTEGGN